MPADFSAEDFFRYAYGIVVDQREPQLIRLWASARRADYLRTLPLHHSQQEVERTAEGSLFSLYLCPTSDFVEALLACGEEVEALSPPALREQVRQRICRMLRRYAER